MNKNSYIYKDEIDLVELAQAIWGERILVFLFIASGVLVGFAFSFAASPQYATQATISPAPINTFGALAEELGARQADSGAFGIKAGTQIAEDAFSIYVKNLRSLSEQRAFRDSYHTTAHFDLSVTQGRMATDPTTISATAGEVELPRDVVESYLAYISKITATQINDYLAGLGAFQRIESSSLYRLEQPAAFNKKPIKPNRIVIMVIGFTLGGLTGLFFALTKVFRKKRSDLI